MQILPAMEAQIPYSSSPPIQFVYRSTAPLVAGKYVWADSPSDVSPLRPIIDNALYFVRDVTLSADVSELDYTSSLVSVAIPKLQLHRKSDAGAVLLREPILMAKFLDNFPYRLWWESHQDNERLMGSFRGELNQGGALIGKASVTLTAIISAQEVTSEGFIEHFKRAYYPGGLPR